MIGKKIAVFITEWDPHFWSLILKGIRNRAKVDGYDVYVFDCFGGAGERRKHDVGEFHIFDLPDLKTFDGVIVAASTIIPTSVVERLSRRIRESGCPAISLEVPIKGLDFGGISNKDSILMVMDHVLTHHKCTKVYFVSGPEGNAEAGMRKEAFIEAMEGRGLRVPEEIIFTGTYEFESGYKAVEYFRELPDGLPEAIVCANDAMAMGVCRRLEELSIDVPEEVIVTGFDNIESANDFVPSITTVDRPKEDLGEQACDYIIQKIKDPSITKGLKCKTRLEFRESCGCVNANLYVGRKFRLKHFRQMEEEDNISRFMNRMMARLTDCDWFSELFLCLQDYVDSLDCERFYFCLDTELVQERIMLSEDQADKMNVRERIKWMKTDFPEKVSVVVATHRGQKFECEDFYGTQIVPDEEAEYKSDSDFYIFEPIHYQDNCFGYCVMVNPSPGRQILGFNQWLLMVGNSIETIRRKHLMNLAIEQLDMLFTTDPLTGLYNRFGYERYSAELVQNCIDAGKPLAVVFFDLDGLKPINDEYGHEEGDVAVKTVAEALKAISEKDDVITRTGGDEFLAIFPAHKDVVEDKIRQFEQALVEKNEELALPFTVSASAGYKIVVPDENTDLEALIEEADHAMYENKEKKKSLQKQQNGL